MMMSKAMPVRRRSPRFHIAGRGEVCWEVMAKWLDRRQAAMYGSNAWVILDLIGLSNVREVALFLT